jgi:hypothetical protein
MWVTQERRSFRAQQGGTAACAALALATTALVMGSLMSGFGERAAVPLHAPLVAAAPRAAVAPALQVRLPTMNVLAARMSSGQVAQARADDRLEMLKNAALLAESTGTGPRNLQ